jgi:hypothetical protein
MRNNAGTIMRGQTEVTPILHSTLGKKMVPAPSVPHFVPVSVSNQFTCCQLGWKSHPIIIIEGSFLPSVFVLKLRLHGFESSLHSYPISPCRVLCDRLVVLTPLPFPESPTPKFSRLRCGPVRPDLDRTLGSGQVMPEAAPSPLLRDHRTRQGQGTPRGDK